VLLLTEFHQDANLDVGEVLLEEGLEFVFTVSDNEAEEVVGFILLPLIQILLHYLLNSSVVPLPQITIQNNRCIDPQHRINSLITKHPLHRLISHFILPFGSDDALELRLTRRLLFL